MKPPNQPRLSSDIVVHHRIGGCATTRVEAHHDSE